MNFSELPEDIRVKLSEEATEEFWNRIDKFGGIKQVSNSSNYSSSKMYNWKSKESFLPIDLVKKFFGNKASQVITEIKGKGRSSSIKDPVLPIPENDELLTRIDLSVVVNSKGTPIYQTDDRGNMERFVELLQKVGEVPYSVYSRELYEVRYPAFLQQIFNEISFEQSLKALIDEEGEIGDGKIVLPDREINIHDFSGELYNREKKFDLALQREDETEIREIVQEESSKVINLI